MKTTTTNTTATATTTTTKSNGYCRIDAEQVESRKASILALLSDEKTCTGRHLNGCFGRGRADTETSRRALQALKREGKVTGTPTHNRRLGTRWTIVE